VFDPSALGDVGVHQLLALEGGAEHRPQSEEVPLLELPSHLERHRLQLLHPHDRVLAPLLVHVDLGGNQPEVGPDVARVAEQQVRPELSDGFRREREGPDRDAVLVELEQVEAAEGRRELILPSARDAEVLPLDHVGELGDLARRHRPVRQHRERAHTRGDQR
jgi:hypothetical protein